MVTAWLASLKTARGDARLAARVTLAYACMHLPAGAGMLLGMAKAALRARAGETTPAREEDGG